jgi:hypothetical protein
LKQVLTAENPKNAQDFRLQYGRYSYAENNILRLVQFDLKRLTKKLAKTGFFILEK